MQEKYTLNTALAAVVGLAAWRRFFTASSCPPPCSLPWACPRRRPAPCWPWPQRPISPRAFPAGTGAYSPAGLTFGLLPWAAGLTAGTEAVRFAVVGGAAFGALTFLFTSLRERLASGPSGRLAPLVTAGILFLACQCFAGMLL